MGGPEQSGLRMKDERTGVFANFGEAPSDVALMTRYEILPNGQRRAVETYYVRNSTFNRTLEVLPPEHPEVLTALGRFATTTALRRSA